MAQITTTASIPTTPILHAHARSQIQASKIVILCHLARKKYPTRTIQVVTLGGYAMKGRLGTSAPPLQDPGQIPHPNTDGFTAVSENSSDASRYGENHSAGSYRKDLNHYDDYDNKEDDRASDRTHKYHGHDHHAYFDEDDDNDDSYSDHTRSSDFSASNHSSSDRSSRSSYASSSAGESSRAGSSDNGGYYGDQSDHS